MSTTQRPVGVRDDDAAIGSVPMIGPDSAGGARRRDDTSTTDPAGDRITLRFLAGATDVTANGNSVPAGRVLEWIDTAGYACAVGWSGTHCATAYVGNIHFTRPIRPGDLVEVRAQIMLTGTTSMHILVTVQTSDVRTRKYEPALHCIVIFVALDADGIPRPVPTWSPATLPDLELQDLAHARIEPRKAIQSAMSSARYSAKGTTPRTVLRFLPAPSDVSSSGKAHGGTVLRWIDEAAYACAVAWSSERAAAVYAGGIEFHNPVALGDIVEVEARLIHTGPHSMHIAVHVRAAPLHAPHDLALTAGCTSVYVHLDDAGRATEVEPLILQSNEDQELNALALKLIELRSGLPAIPPSSAEQKYSTIAP